MDATVSQIEINGRVLKTEQCSGSCGKMLAQWVAKDGGKCICGECKDALSRQRNGWTPANSSN
jgi:hypothetical protein